ncbi:membrane metallo-endopeptidase-like 1 [Aplysia californica]|uniref:Membrane metallo-endopeptidase-like 1 n=1 Tax=Aplysia californica TaxID=6500 RepID=A0ABM1AE19_APLCA|nr:membrane metallo-endopeptidase-like 1 [Aplysia californica]
MGFGSVGKSESTYSVDESENANQMKQFTVSENDVKLGEKKKKNKMSGAMKALLVVLLLALVAVVVLAVVIIKIRDDDKEVVKDTQEELADRYKETCLTPTCVSAAARIMNNIDASVHPCDNFYDFACGGWVKKHELTEDRPRISVLSEYVEEVDEEVQRILEEPPSDDDLKSVRSAKNLYQSCRDLETIDKRGDQPFKDWLKAKMGDWPLISSAWNDATFDLTDVLIRAANKGSRPLIGLVVDQDFKNPSVHILTLGQPSFGMPSRKSYLVPRNDTMLMAYQTFIYNVAETLGFANPDTAQQDVKDIVDFEIKLAQISASQEKRRDAESQYNPMTLAEVHGNYSTAKFDFTKFVTSLLKTPEVGVSDVTGNEIIINFAPQYFRKFGDVISRTQKRTLANYAFWRVAQDYVGTLSKPYRQLDFEYNKVLHGITREQPRDKMCTSYTKDSAGFVIGKTFVERHFQPETKTTILDIVAGLRSVFNEQVDEISWMDEDTKRLAKEKNAAIRVKIGYPEFLTNATQLEDTFSNYTFKSYQYFENSLLIKKEDYAKNMRKLRKPVQTNEWGFSPVVVNANYSPLKNEMEFPAAYLLPPVYSKDFPKFLNYGVFGTVAGHELTHGFDDQGRQFDKTGHLKQWWSDSAIQKFKDKAQCIVDQYSAYVMEDVGMNLNGIITQGENMADNGGLRQAFRAYRNWVKTRGKEEPTLPGLNYSNNQLFFLSYAQLWCGLVRKEIVIQQIRSGPHSPGRYRTIGPTQNSEDFSREFNCPQTSYMNAEKKCRVW